MHARLEERDEVRLLLVSEADAEAGVVARGEFAPSTSRKTGSSPLVFSNRSRTSAGEIVQPVLSTWHEAHVRPLVPRLWKNGLFTSSARPSNVAVRRTPAWFCESGGMCLSAAIDGTAAGKEPPRGASVPGEGAGESFAGRGNSTWGLPLVRDGG